MNGLTILFLILPIIVAILVDGEMSQFVLKCSYFTFVVTGFICHVFTPFFYWLYFLIVYVVVFNLFKNKNRER